jgi:hypothetical protein
VTRTIEHPGRRDIPGSAFQYRARWCERREKMTNMSSR